MKSMATQQKGYGHTPKHTRTQTHTLVGRHWQCVKYGVNWLRHCTSLTASLRGHSLQLTASLTSDPCNHRLLCPGNVVTIGSVYDFFKQDFINDFLLHTIFRFILFSLVYPKALFYLFFCFSSAPSAFSILSLPSQKPFLPLEREKRKGAHVLLLSRQVREHVLSVILQLPHAKGA